MIPSFIQVATRVSSPVPSVWAYTCVDRKQFWLLEGDRILETHPVGTGSRPPSCLEHSGGTPWGLHRVAQCIGAGAPLGTVFESRLPVGLHSQVDPDVQRITTRILRLEGLEPGVNRGHTPEGLCCDTFARYVYLHGTPYEDKPGTAFTQGCLSLHDPVMARIFPRLPRGSLVLIEPAARF